MRRLNEIGSGGKIRRTVVYVALSTVSFCISAVNAQTPGHDVPERMADARPRIGLALEGGGALGIAHIGVLMWLHDHRIPVDEITGTSMGALIGSLAASGHSAEEIGHLTTDTNFDGLFTLKPSMSDLSFRRRTDQNELPQTISIGLRHGTPSIGNALIADGELNAFLARQLSAYNSENLDFDALPIPFRCVATNLTTLQPAVFRSGSLPFAVRASISIPGVFPPVRRGQDILVDGAIMDNLPTDVLRSELHAQIVIAVYLGDSPFPEQDATSLVAIFARTLSAGTSRNVELNRARADIEIAPQLDNFSVTDYRSAKALIKAGYDAAEKQRTKLLLFAISESDWRVYEAALTAKLRRPPADIKVTGVSGPDPSVSAHVAAVAKRLQDRPFEPERAEAVVSTVRGNGALDAYYETFQSSAAGSNTPGKNPDLPDDGVEIYWGKKADGPPYLLLGTEVAAATSNVTSSIFDVRFVDQNFGGYGSELRSDVRIGYLTQVGTEYYRPLGTSRLFIQPSVQILREPVYLWEDQKRVSERFFQHAGGGFDVGLAVNQNLQASLEYRASTIRWKLVSGADSSPTPQLSGRVESAAAHFVYTTRTAAIASPHGAQIDFTIGHLFDTSASADAPFAKLNARQSFTFAGTNLISLSTEVDTYFRNTVEDPLRFTLGGPLRLYASSVDEYRGTDIELVRAIYLRRIASLPTGIGQGIYLTGGYEQGNVWSPEHPAIFRQDGFGGVLLSTPVGAITFGGAIGDADHRKIFFTFGKLF
jgi:NTE family protein